MATPINMRKERRAYRLHMTAPLHVGEVGIGLEETLTYVPSDTLFSALVVTWSTLTGHVDAVTTLATSFADRPPLLLTSAFPFVGDILLLPRPQLMGLYPRSSSNSAKTFKRVRWVSPSILAQLVSGISPTQLDELWAQGVHLQAGSVWVSLAEATAIAKTLGVRQSTEGQLWAVTNVPKVTVDRIQNAGTLFHVGRTHFARGCGLWCLAEGERAWLDRTNLALTLMGDTGIGGQRSRGNGQFRFEEVSPPELGLDESSPYHLLLSRLAPRPDEMNLLQQPAASYQVVTVGGWNGTPGDSPVIRRQVRMVAEGAIVGSGDRPPGNLVNVTPAADLVGHRIYRYGYGFTVPVQLPQGIAHEVAP